MPKLTAFIITAVSISGIHAARVQAGNNDEGLSLGVGPSVELTPMKGFYTSHKLEYDPLTRYADGKEVKDAQLLIELLQKAAKKNPNQIALRQPVQDEDGNLVKKTGAKATWLFADAKTYQYKKYTWKQYHDRVMDAATAFVSMGLKPMDAVNIRGVNSPEWLITFLGCIAAGGLPVGLYPTDSADTVKFKAKDSGAAFIVVGKSKDLQVYSEFLNEEDFKYVKAVIYWDANPEHPESLDGKVLQKLNTPERPVIMWEHFVAQGTARTASAFRDQVKRGLREQRPGQASTVVYTSGTTGNPKGVLLSQDSLTWSAAQVAKQIMTKTPPGGQMRIYSYLPLNHIAGQMLDIIAPLHLTSRKKGEYTTIFFPAKCFKACFPEQMKDAQPTLFLGVPVVWEGLQLKIEAATKSWLMGHVKRLSPTLVLKGVGLGSVMWAVSGAGPITKSTLNFYHDMGLNILNMFAQSESSALGTSWRNEDFGEFDLQQKFGSIGRPLGNKLKISNPNDEGKGEIELWGRNIMLGYMNREDKTSEAITADGWLKTGDMGRIDEDDFVFLTGRLKEIMKDKGGEMIAPVAVEEGVKKACNKPGTSIVKQAIVVGDGKFYISVLLTLVEEDQNGVPTGKLAGGAKDVDDKVTTVKDAIKSPKWASELSGCIAEYNKVAAKSQEKVYRYLILPKDITAEDSPDLMTPTFKIKREGVNERYSQEIETCGGDAALPDRQVKACGSS